jgi:hypothetical protein
MARKDQRGEIPDPRVFPECELVGPELEAVDVEIRRVLDRFGYQSLTLFDWASILGEEYGEVCKAINDHEFGTSGEGGLQDVYREAIQVAAVAVHIAAVIRESGL